MFVGERDIMLILSEMSKMFVCFATQISSFDVIHYYMSFKDSLELDSVVPSCPDPI